MGIIYKGDIPLGVGVGGVSAYEAAVAAGYTGTTEEFSARMAASPTTVTFTATIGTTWTGASAPFTQNLTVAAVNGYTIVEADTPIIDVVLPSDPTAANAILDAWSKVSKINTVDGGLVVACNSLKPTVAIPIQIKVVRVNSFRSLVTPDNIISVMNDVNAVTQLNLVTKDATSALMENVGWNRLATYTTPGSYTWVAPDLFNGKQYLIGVMVIGGGGGGGAMASSNTSAIAEATGGGSGYSSSYTLKVTPGSSYALVVGAGGARTTVTSSTGKTGVAGGSSAFNGVTSKGGNGGVCSAATNGAAAGAQPSLPYANSKFGGEFPSTNESSALLSIDPLSCFNPFEGCRILGGGGSGSMRSTSNINAYTGGKDPVTGLGGGNGAVGDSMSVSAQDATMYGCGGGGAVSRVTLNATSGAGGNGAVFLYVQGVKP